MSPGRRRALGSSLVLLLVAAAPAGARRGGRPRAPAPPRAAPPRAAPQRTVPPVPPGFGHRTTGGAGRPTFTVTTLADAGKGSLRDALARAVPGGGTIRFAVGGGIRLAAGLDVPGRTTIDGTSAPAPGITLWGERTGARGTGVLNIAESNVVLRGLRIRDAGNDGVHIAPRRRAVANVVVDHCSVTNSRDGGIDITGRDGLPVADVTVVASYLAGNGGPCPKGLCGGGTLASNGATRLSWYFNVWDENLRRTPSVTGPAAVADIRWNVVRATVQGGIQIRDGARANLVGNTLEGSSGRTAAVALWGGRAYVEGTPSDVTAADTIPALPVPQVPKARAASVVLREAGALPRDAVDSGLLERAAARVGAR